MTDHDDGPKKPETNDAVKPSRREFLKGTLAGAATVSLGTPSAVAAEYESSSQTQQPVEEFDVAIVGAGVAGCYVAYRLLHGDIDPNSPLGKLKASNLPYRNVLKVGLFEYSGRVGGRLASARIPLPNSPDAGIGDSAQLKYAEFGGFRFQEQMHIVRDLATLLGLSHEPFPVDEPAENPVYVRGTRLTQGTLGDVNKLPYHFTEAEKAVLEAPSSDFTTYVANQAFAGYLPDDPDDPPNGGPAHNGYFTLRKAYHTAFQGEQWSKVKTLRDEYETAKQKVVIDGRPLKDWSWWALMSKFLSPEAIAYLDDTGGYNSRWSPGNVSSNLRENFYFATAHDIYGNSHPTNLQHTAWQHIKTGYSDIPNRLYVRFLKAGGTGRLNHQLVRFDKAAGGGYELLFFRRESGTTTSGQAEYQCAQDPNACRRVRAKFLVLAMPKRSLELLDRSTFFLRDVTVNKLLDTVLNDPAVRIFMAYKTPWWTAKGLKRGRSTTDLQVRQFYYWLTAPGQPSFLLASYSNAQAERYWHSLEGGPAYDDSRGSVAQAGRNDGPQGIGPRAASETMAKLAHKQIMQVVGVTDAPEPYYAHFQNWTKEPWGAGWHAFTAGHNDNTLIPQILQPLPDEQIYICGECWSNVQGWVQGALNTSETMLQTKLSLAWPSWLQKGGTWLGPGDPSDPLDTF